jgi:hypothetical protein
MSRLAELNTWWADAGWERSDPDLEQLAEAPFRYEPEPLHGIRPDGLYLLRGPRRVGKSVEVKRAIARLIESGVNPRSIIYFACNGLSMTEIQGLVRAAFRCPRSTRFGREISPTPPGGSRPTSSLRSRPTSSVSGSSS